MPRQGSELCEDAATPFALKGKIQPVGFALVETAAVGQQRGQAMELIVSSGERLQIGCGHSDRTGFQVRGL